MKNLSSPFFYYYGGKWRDAKHYPTPVHNTIVEPFAGGAGYSLRYPDLAVFLFDLDPVIVGVWDFLIRASYNDLISLPLLGLGETANDLNVCQEARHLIGFWLNHGTSGPRISPSTRMLSGARPNSYWGETVRARIAEQQHAIKHWRVQCVSYADLPRPQATWFVDPPYQTAGKHYRKGAGAIDFRHLGEWCKSLPGQAIVCENAGADWLPFVPHRTVRTNRKDCLSKEVIWTS